MSVASVNSGRSRIAEPTLKKVYTANNEAEATMLRDRLTHAGIHATIHGGVLTNAVGDIPFISAWPTVHVADEDAEQALALVEQWTQPISPETVAEAWTCPRCGEWIEGQFTECWSCRTTRPDSR
jgi:predicted RNA-binding Zn-ribbon protein involved in translation (DUF1610 family)